MEQAVDNARNANAAKIEFLFRMSHDIRTPMNIIVGMTEIAKKHINDSEKLTDCMDRVKYRIRRKDGEFCWLDDYGNLVRNKETCDIFYAFVADSTDKNH